MYFVNKKGGLIMTEKDLRDHVNGTGAYADTSAELTIHPFQVPTEKNKTPTTKKTSRGILRHIFG